MAATPTTPTRVDSTLFAAAKVAGARSHRSAAQQLAHWAALGQEIESSGLSHRDIDRVLAGQASYDDLNELDQAAVRRDWRQGVRAGIAALDLAAEFSTQGRTRWSEADEDGNVTVHLQAEDGTWSATTIPAGTTTTTEPDESTGGTKKATRSGRRSRSA